MSKIGIKSAATATVLKEATELYSSQQVICDRSQYTMRSWPAVTRMRTLRDIIVRGATDKYGGQSATTMVRGVQLLQSGTSEGSVPPVDCRTLGECEGQEGVGNCREDGKQHCMLYVVSIDHPVVQRFAIRCKADRNRRRSTAQREDHGYHTSPGQALEEAGLPYSP